MSWLASPLAHGLVAGAIIESGSIMTPLPRLKEAESSGTAFAGARSIDALPESFAAELPRAGQGMKLGVIVDGYVLKDDPAAVFARHEELKPPLIVGNNAPASSRATARA